MSRNMPGASVCVCVCVVCVYVCVFVLLNERTRTHGTGGQIGSLLMEAALRASCHPMFHQYSDPGIIVPVEAITNSPWYKSLEALQSDLASYNRAVQHKARKEAEAKKEQKVAPAASTATTSKALYKEPEPTAPSSARLREIIIMHNVFPDAKTLGLYAAVPAIPLGNRERTRAAPADLDEHDETESILFQMATRKFGTDFFNKPKQAPKQPVKRARDSDMTTFASATTRSTRTPPPAKKARVYQRSFEDL